jgi:hypothetical protein
VQAQKQVTAPSGRRSAAEQHGQPPAGATDARSRHLPPPSRSSPCPPPTPQSAAGEEKKYCYAKLQTDKGNFDKKYNVVNFYKYIMYGEFDMLTSYNRVKHMFELVFEKKNIAMLNC